MVGLTKILQKILSDSSGKSTISHLLKSSVIPLLALARRSWKAGSAAVLLLEKAFRGHGLMQLKLYLSCDLFSEFFLTHLNFVLK